jgi:hypothetical protein
MCYAVTEDSLVVSPGREVTVMALFALCAYIILLTVIVLKKK